MPWDMDESASIVTSMGPSTSACAPNTAYTDTRKARRSPPSVPTRSGSRSVATPERGLAGDVAARDRRCAARHQPSRYSTPTLRCRC